MLVTVLISFFRPYFEDAYQNRLSRPRPHAVIISNQDGAVSRDISQRAHGHDPSPGAGVKGKSSFRGGLGGVGTMHSFHGSDAGDGSVFGGGRQTDNGDVVPLVGGGELADFAEERFEIDVPQALPQGAGHGPVDDGLCCRAPRNESEAHGTS